MSTTVQHQPWCTTHSEKDPNSLKTEEWCSRDTRIGGEDGPLVAVNNAEGVLEIELWQANGDCRLAPAEAREVRLRADVRSRPRADGSREASRRAIGASVTACMVDRGITPQRLAQDIGMTEGNLWRRLAGASGFTAEDISRIARTGTQPTLTIVGQRRRGRPGCELGALTSTASTDASLHPGRNSRPGRRWLGSPMVVHASGRSRSSSDPPGDAAGG